MEINNKLYFEIENYCKINEINDVEKYINNLLRQAFTKDKYCDVIKIGNNVTMTNIEEIKDKVIVRENVIEEDSNFIFREDNEDE